MKRVERFWMVVAAVLALGAAFAWLDAGAAAQQALGRISGEVRDRDGKPFPDLTIILKNPEIGQSFELKTDKDGKFFQSGLRSGVYDITVKQKDQVLYEMNVRVPVGEEATANINFKELLAQQGDAVKKQEEEKKEFETLKAHFDAGRTALEQARQVRNDISRTPAEQRAAMQQKVTELSQTAITEFLAAQKAAQEKDPNLNIVMFNLARSYDAAGRYDEAAAAYQKAVELNPTQAEYYLEWGTTLARAGKVQEATTACEKGAAIDKTTGVACLRNVGIVLYNAKQMKEAIEPLRKAVEMDPKSAQAWYLLGAALVNTMGYKQEGDKVIPILQPGTIEAYQKAIELDPNGPYGAEAKQGLEALQQMGIAGIQTKVQPRKPKK